MNFLQLCREVARESGTLAGGSASMMTTVVSVSGRAEKIVNWVAQAWTNVQLEHDDWFFMRREFEHPLTAGKSRYSAADLGIDRLGVWLVADECDYPFTIWDTDKGKADESGLLEIDYSLYRARYARGVHDPARPTEFAVSPSLEICLGATPSKPFIMTGMYVASPQLLSAEEDVPEMPAQYHRIIVWEAIKLMSIADEAVTALQTSVGEYSRLRDALARDQRPRSSISFGSDAVIA